MVLSLMQAHERLVTDFYTAFQRRDGEAMAACYHPDATFSDPVFPRLNAAEAGAMWRMFCAGDTPIAIEFSDIVCTNLSGRAHWEARYQFQATGRAVHNRIDATFKFLDHKIVAHEDNFAFWSWTRMALGTPGLLLGWTPVVRGKVRAMARARLDKFIRG